MTEAVGGDTHLSKADHLLGGARLSSAGQPSLHVELRIVDEDGITVDRGQAGEILMRGPMVMAGYWRRPVETEASIAEHGGLRKGDVGALHHQGHLVIVDPKNGGLLAGAVHIYHSEDDAALTAQPEAPE